MEAGGQISKVEAGDQRPEVNSLGGSWQPDLSGGDRRSNLLG